MTTGATGTDVATVVKVSMVTARCRYTSDLTQVDYKYIPLIASTLVSHTAKNISTELKVCKTLRYGVERDRQMDGRTGGKGFVT